MNARMVAAATLSIALVVAPVSAVDKSSAWGNLKAQGKVEVNGTPIPAETTVFAGDLVNAKVKSLATLTLAGGNQVFVFENSAARFLADSKSVTLERGALGVLHRGGESVKVTSQGTLIHPKAGKAARYLVKLEGRGFILSSLSGDVEVMASNRTVTVPSGKSMRVEVAEASQGAQGAGAASANALAGKTVIIVSAIVVATTLAIALPLALRDNGTVSPAIP